MAEDAEYIGLIGGDDDYAVLAAIGVEGMDDYAKVLLPIIAHGHSSIDVAIITVSNALSRMSGKVIDAESAILDALADYGAIHYDLPEYRM